MGRELKRVPLDFDWPVRKVWAGYLNPFYTAEKCGHCEGTGEAPDTKRLSEQWYGYAFFHPSETGSELLTPDTPAVRAFAERNVNYSPEFYGRGESAIRQEALRLCSMWNKQWVHHLDTDDVAALLEAGRLWDFTRNGIEKPTPQQVNEWSILSVGHDSLNQWICVKAKAKRLGYQIECDHCHGEGRIWESNAAKQLYENWQNIEPPTGDGWQLWETTTEGSPVSPVFATADELVNWMVADGYSREGAEAFVKSGWAPSLVMTPGKGVQSGVDAMAEE